MAPDKFCLHLSLTFALILNYAAFAQLRNDTTGGLSENGKQEVINGTNAARNGTNVRPEISESSQKGNSTTVAVTGVEDVSSAGDEGVTAGTNSQADMTKDARGTTVDSLSLPDTKQVVSDNRTEGADTNPRANISSTQSSGASTVSVENATVTVRGQPVSMVTNATEAPELISNTSGSVSDVKDDQSDVTTSQNVTAKSNTTTYIESLSVSNQSVTSPMIDIPSATVDNRTTWGITTTLPVNDGASTTAGQLEYTTETTTVGQKLEDNLCNLGVCENGASCSPGSNGTYLCNCTAGWTGTNCTEDFDECNSSPCKNGATCENGRNNFLCICHEGYSGRLCETDIDECSSSPCLNGGRCINTNGGYSCSCLEGYSGTSCQTDIDECSSGPCQNNGTCIDQINAFKCNCTRYWTGDFCQSDVDECMSTDVVGCDPMASCTNTIGGFSCICPTGFKGDGLTCQFLDFCETKPCNNGSCISRMMGFECLCERGWTGYNCTDDVNECETPSKGDCDVLYGECINTFGSHECRCMPGSQGDGFTCYRDTLYPVGESGILIRGDDVTTNLLAIPGGFPYFGKRHYQLQVSMNGYATLGEDILPPNPPEGGTNMTTRVPIIAPWWMDMDTSSGPGGLYVDRYTLNDTSDPVVEMINADIDSYLTEQSVSIKFGLVATWNEVEPYPSYESGDIKEKPEDLPKNVTFQLVLASTLKESFAIFNYNPAGPWFSKDSPERRFAVAYTDATDTLTKMSVRESPRKLSNIRHPGRFFFHLGQKVDEPGADCIAWYLKAKNNPPRLTLPCPCSRPQALLDTRFKYDEISTCFMSRFITNRQRQQCCFDSQGALLTGYPGGGYPLLQDEETIRDTCCLVNKLCHLFYEARPSDNCSNYIIPSWGLAWGLGNIYRLENKSIPYTFDGRGEFHLLTNGDFSLQGRMDRVPSVDAGFNATALVAIAAKGGNTSKVEVRLSASENRLTIAVDEEDRGDLMTWRDAIPNQFTGVHLQRVHNSSLLVQFANGIGFMIKRVHDVLRLRVMAEDVFKDFTGLFISKTEGDKIEQARLMEGDSLFTYSIDGKAASDFRFEDYRPSDLSAIFDSLRNEVAANNSAEATSCDGLVACFHDYIVTGRDIYRGVSAITEEVFMHEQRRILENSPPKFSPDLPSTLSVRVNEPFNKVIFVRDPDGQRILYNISTNLHPDEYQLSAQGVFSWTPTNVNRSIYIKFMASDGGSSSIWWPMIMYDACDVDGGVSSPMEMIPGVASNEERFYFSHCKCLPGYYGEFCSKTYNVCGPNPCFDSSADCTAVSVTESPFGVQCGPCPGGLKGDGLKCYDENECTRNTHNCDQQCTNLPGGFKCGCAEGFTLLEDGVTCLDNDECTDDEHTCREVGQYCKNIPGGFMCACTSQYFMDNGTCILGPKRFGGQISFGILKLVGDNGISWDDELSDTNSPIFKIAAEKTTDVLDDAFKDITGFIKTKVTSFREGSIVADFNIYADSSTTATGPTLNDQLQAYLQDKGCSESGPDCNVGDLMDVDITASNAGAKDLCLSKEDNDCDIESTNCTSHGDGSFSCKCRTGYQSWLDLVNICQDRNECENYHTCDPNTAQCINTPGSFRCECQEGYRLLGAECVPVCSPSPCLHKGTCQPAPTTVDRYTCTCTGKWHGRNCEVVNKEANKLEQILIGVGVGLGILCLILVIIIIVVCIKRTTPKKPKAMPYDDINDKKLNDSFDIESKMSHSVWVDRLFSSALSLHDDDHDLSEENTKAKNVAFGKQSRIPNGKRKKAKT